MTASVVKDAFTTQSSFVVPQQTSWSDTVA